MRARWVFGLGYISKCTCVVEVRELLRGDAFGGKSDRMLKEDTNTAKNIHASGISLCK